MIFQAVSLALPLLVVSCLDVNFQKVEEGLDRLSELWLMLSGVVTVTKSLLAGSLTLFSTLLNVCVCVYIHIHVAQGFEVWSSSVQAP